MSEDELHDTIMRTLCLVEMGPGFENSRFGWRHHADALVAELAALRADAERYRWLADKVLACDYGDNDKGCVGWHIRHCKGPAWIAGDSIDAAIDAARGGHNTRPRAVLGER